MPDKVGGGLLSNVNFIEVKEVKRRRKEPSDIPIIPTRFGIENKQEGGLE